jgi:hypothetical protein
MNMMKKIQDHFKSRGKSKQLILASFAFIAFTLAANAQNGDGFGIRAGLNYNANGDYF